VNTAVEGIKWAKGKGLNELTYEEFLNRFDSLKTTINRFHNSYIDSVALPNDLSVKLQYKNSIKFFEVAQEYKFYKLNDRLNKKWEAQNNGKDYLEAKVSNEFENLAKEVPFDSTLLEDGYNDYQTLLNYYWHSHINLRVSEQLLVSKAQASLMPLMANALIKKGDYPEAIREFLIAFDLQYRFGIQ
jgi:hypothetical protein